MRRGTAVTPGTFATAGNAVKPLSHWTDRHPGGGTSPCVTFQPPLPAAGVPALPCRSPALTTRPGPAIMKDVIYVTFNTHRRNASTVGVSHALPALCMGKPITAGVVAF